MQLSLDKKVLHALNNLNSNKDFGVVIEWLKGVKSEKDSLNELIDDHLIRWNQGHRQILGAIIEAAETAYERLYEIEK